MNLCKKNIMQKISDKLDKINLYISELREEEKSLKEIRDTLLPKLMSSEIILDKKIIIY